MTTEGHWNLGLLPFGSFTLVGRHLCGGKDQSSSVSSLNPNASWPLTSCVTIGPGLFSIYKLRIKILAPIRLIRKDKIFPVIGLMHKKHQITGSRHHHHHSHSGHLCRVFLLKGQVLGSRSKLPEGPLLHRVLDLCSVIKWKHLLSLNILLFTRLSHRSKVITLIVIVLIEESPRSGCLDN